MGNQGGLSIRDLSFLPLGLRLMDAAVFTLAGYFAYIFYLEQFPIPTIYRLSFVGAFLLCLIIFPMFGLYTSWRGKGLFEQAHRLVMASLTVFLFLVLLSVAIKSTINYSRVWMGLWVTFGTLGVVVYRELLFAGLRHLRQKGWNTKNIVLIGNHDFNERVTNRLLQADWTGFRIVQTYDEAELNNMLEDPANAESSWTKLIKSKDVLEIWVTLPLQQAHQIKELTYLIRNCPQAKIRYVPDISDFQLLLNNSVSEIAGIVTLDLNHSPVEGINSIVKEIEDRVLAALILVLISPILLIVAIAVRLDSKGPILFKQPRHGWGGRPINVYKFRTMKCDGSGAFEQAKQNDPRVTRIGAFLRRTSLDELPQFFNVLQGRMSIVGPRPHAVEHNYQFMNLVDNYFTRNKVKPGITGWAQVNGWRGETDTLKKMESRVEHDLYYIRNWSVWFDLKIIFLTVFRGFIGKNAY